MSNTAQVTLDVQSRTTREPMVVAINCDGAATKPLADILWSLDGVLGGSAILRGADGTRLILDYAPAQIPAILVGDGGQQKAERFLHWLEIVGYSRAPQILQWRRGSEAEALKHVNKELARLVSASGTRQVQAAQQAARLQASNAELQYRFAVAENALLRSGGMPLELAFSNDPVADPAQLVALAETEGGVAQILPVGSNGVSAVSIHLVQGIDAAHARLAAQLRSLEDGRIVEQWMIEARDLVPGWNVLALARTLSGLSRTLELRLSQVGAEDRLPPLSLGAGQPITTYQIRDIASGQPALRNSLALQIWTGVPGARIPAWFKRHAPVKSSSPAGGFSDIPLAPSALVQVEHANPHQISFDFPAVVGPPGEGAVLCHPPSIGLTLARLSGQCPKGAMRVSASAFIDNQQSRDVDFALLIADNPQRACAIADGNAQPVQFEAFSGWQLVGRNQTKRVSAFRDAQAPGADIYIATRMSQAGDNSFARARLKDFSIMVQS